MIFRQAKSEEINSLFREGYEEWSKNRTFEQYCTDNGKEDAYGTRYIMDVNGKIVSSLILLKLRDINGKKAYGIGSVLTPKVYAGNGYATELLKNCIKQIPENDFFIFLYSDINPSFYEKFNFRILPAQLQKYEKSTCMAYCKDNIWNELLNSSAKVIPDYF